MDYQLTPRLRRVPVRFPNRIRQYRVRAGWSQRALAHRLDRAMSMVCLWERGRRLPSLPNALRLARTLGSLTEELYPAIYRPDADHPGEVAE